jgi:hypothetical protein
MPECACGCGEETKRGKYLQGHEQKLRKQPEDKVGSLQLLSSLVKVTQMFARGRRSPDELGRLVRLMSQKWSRGIPMSMRIWSSTHSARTSRL